MIKDYFLEELLEELTKKNVADIQWASMAIYHLAIACNNIVLL